MDDFDSDSGWARKGATAMTATRKPTGVAGPAGEFAQRSPPHEAPIVFLVGPPGSGKSTLGRRVSAELGLRFVDLVHDGSTDAALHEIVRARGADVVALPWAPERDAGWLEICRRSGKTLGLWAHPLDMQARSGRTEPLFTPVPRLKIRGGFGHRGTSCTEHRHLRRACEYVLYLFRLSEDDAAQELKASIEDLPSPEEGSPAEREGLHGWVDDWRHDFRADTWACQILVDAMARFTLHLRAQGTSPRAMSAVFNDLNAAGFLVMCRDAPKGKAVLRSFDSEPSEYEYGRWISESPRTMARFRSTWEAFRAFLLESSRPAVVQGASSGEVPGALPGRVVGRIEHEFRARGALPGYSFDEDD